MYVFFQMIYRSNGITNHNSSRYYLFSLGIMQFCCTCLRQTKRTGYGSQKHLSTDRNFWHTMEQKTQISGKRTDFSISTAGDIAFYMNTRKYEYKSSQQQFQQYCRTGNYLNIHQKRNSCFLIVVYKNSEILQVGKYEYTAWTNLMTIILTKSNPANLEENFIGRILH